ncbi:MAG: hypothetical protein JWM68_3006 [Verrucomicrobiales bacterium]|nr:hypothetical protein [Verrucomicrobiales bacterium]
MAKECSQLKWFYRGFLAIAAFLALYVLSYGPACSLTARSIISRNTYSSVYKRFIPKPLRVAYVNAWVHVDPVVGDIFANGGY